VNHPIRWGYAYALVPEHSSEAAVWPLEHHSTLLWSPDDPHAVVTNLGGHEWTFAWDLLNTGLDRPAGVGDVRVAPLGFVAGGYRHEIVLSSPGGHAELQIRTASLRTFVHTVRAVWADRPLTDDDIAAFWAKQDAQ